VAGRDSQLVVHFQLRISRAKSSVSDLEGKSRRIRTVAIPIWVKHGIHLDDRGGIEDGPLLRSVSKSGRVNREG
jgi:hypothetical protein